MIVPSGSSSLYAKRRLKAFSHLKTDSDLAIVFNSPKYPRNNDNQFPYRADSNFYYLSGVIEEETALVFFWKKHGNSKVPVLISFARPNDPAMEQWDGKRLGLNGIKQKLKAQESFEIGELAKFVHGWLMNQKKGTQVRIFTNALETKTNKEKLFHILDQFPFSGRKGVAQPHAIINIADFIHQQRLIKDPYEIKTLKKSCQINVEAHLELMKKIKPGMYEYETKAIVDGYYLRHGCSGSSYPSICATGANATILHYNENNAQMKKGQLFLIDAGCEYQNYASDITRTYSVDGHYSKEQESIMDLVLEAQQEGIQGCYPGNTWSKVHSNVSKCLIEGLRSLKILKGSTREILEKETHRRFFPHSTGHWLGLDVHDNNPYFVDGKEIPFEEGMVLTIEPGLYFLEQDDKAPKAYRGIGVRIEDDILIQKGKKAYNLTGELPKSVKDLTNI